MGSSVPLRYVEYGRGATPVVLLHGLFGSPDNWKQIMEDLADDYYFFAVQFPIDHGEGRCHRKFRGVDQLTDYVEEIIDELQLDKAILCGNSLGGQVAVDYSLRHPDRVDRLIITGSAGLFERNLNDGKRPQIDRDSIRLRAREIFYDERHCTEEIVEDVHRMLHDRRFARFLIRVAKATRDRNMKEDLSQLHMPTQIIWGRNDIITPPFVAEEFHEGIPNARLCYIEECGHAPPIEQPSEFARLMREFLEDTSPVEVAQ
jgi:2-hydroxy-6-oxonona-2,4-dienedioate hydrolase